MTVGARCAVVLPALNEEGAVQDIAREFREVVPRVVVVDNGSSDRTAERASQGGAEVVSEPRRGYGSACLAGLAHLRDHDPPSVVVFCDCDGSSRARDLPRLLAPIQAGEADLVLGRRVPAEPGAILFHQRLGNSAVMSVYRLLFGLQVSDPSPFRALTWTLAAELDLKETKYGFPLEMLVRGTQRAARVREVPVDYFRRRTGQSKIAGSVRGTLGASLEMFALGLRLRVEDPRAP
jgi:glycosyltransferase involved in cell wall biosynthesis